MPDDDTDADPWYNYESGPFCRHFADPWDHDEECERCGHKCCEHGAGVDDNEPCSHEGCACPGWVGVA